MDILRLALMVAALAACAPSLAGFGEIPDAAGGDAAPAEAAVRPDTADVATDAPEAPSTPDAAPVADVPVETAAPDAPAADAAEVSADVLDAAEASTDVHLRPCSVTSECGTLRPGWVPSCQRGECVDVCPMSYADCDGNVVNGCETRITSRINCGACGRVCERSSIVRDGGVYECV